MPVNNFDYQIVHFFNQFCRKSVVFDKAMVVVANNTLIKGGVLMILFWYQWFLQTKNSFITRQRIIATICGCLISMLIVRMLTWVLPFRARPILNPDNNLSAAFGLNTNLVDNTNSF